MPDYFELAREIMLEQRKRNWIGRQERARSQSKLRLIARRSNKYK